MTILATGVDMSKADFAVAAWVDGQALELGTYQNSKKGFADLQSCLQEMQRKQSLGIIHLVVEPTGGYEMALVAFAHEQGWQVSLPNPKQVRDWGKGTGRRAKTDRQDAQLLAHYGAECQPAHQPPVPAMVSELDSLLKRRTDLEQILRQERNRLNELGNRPGIADAVVTNLQRTIQALEEALHEMNDAIEEHVGSHQELKQQRKRLLALPGIGPKNVLSLLVLLFRWHILTHGQGSSKALTAYVGLDPQPHESGRSVRKRATISKMGNSEVRRLLYMGALSAVHGHNPLNPFYRRLLGRGKAKKLALVAAARKILTWAWIIFSKQTDWDPAYHTN